MSATPRKLSLVIVGQFNQAILVPPWLTKHGLISGGTRTQVHIDLGGEMHMRHRGPNLDWRVDRGRLIVEASVKDDGASSSASAIAALVIGILEKLPHTPVLQVLFTVTSALSATPVAAAGSAHIKDVAEALGAEALTSSVRFSCIAEDGSTINVELGQVPLANAPTTEQVARFTFQTPVVSVADAISVAKHTADRLRTVVDAQNKIIKQALS